MVTLPYAAAASRLAGLLDASATSPRGDPAPLGIRVLLSALAPYAATSRICVVDAAAASRAVVGDPSAFVIRDLLSYVAPRLPLLNAAVIPFDASTTTSTTLVDASAPRGDAALAPYAATTRAFLIDAAAAASRAALIGDPVAWSPRYLVLSTAAASFDPFTTTAPLDATAASRFDASAASIALASPYAAGTRTLSLNSGASLHRQGTTVLQRPFCFLTRSVSTTTTTVPDQVSSVAGARIFRQLNKKRQATRVKPAAGATRVRREAGLLESLDVTLRDMGYITRGPFARLFVLFTVFTIMSEGVRECKLRFGQLSLALSSLRDEGEVQEGSEGWIQLVSIMGEDFGWLFE